MIGLLVLLGIAGLAFVAFTSASGGVNSMKSEGVTTAQAVRSFAINFGLYLAMLAVAVGLIDVLQAAFGGERVAGTNADLARGLSLLIIGTPVFALLARLLNNDRKTRAEQGDTRAGRGWSVHLVAALATTLIAALVSTGQIIDTLFNADRQTDSDEVAQLIGWFVVWVAYWFGLRPRLGVRGNVHLLIGSSSGLLWLAVGLGGLLGGVLDRLYWALFGSALADAGDVRPALVGIVVGAFVWGWHWKILNGSGQVEPDARRSPSWHAMAVAFAIVPATVVMLAATYTAIAGTLIWFFGTVDESAIDWFDEAPSVLAALAIGLAVWAYHRWELLRGEGRSRNESLRFHDYAIAAVGLTAVVVGLMLAFNFVFNALTLTGTIAEAFMLSNWLIATIVLLALGAWLWWRNWNRIEGHWRDQPFEESDSVWRKLYLILGAGFCALSMAGSAIWIVFALLRDVFDGELGRGTIDAIASPLGWLLAVAGAVWFHLGVWRADRSVLAAHAERASAQPAPPAPGMMPVVVARVPDAPTPSTPVATAVAAPVVADATAEIVIPPEFVGAPPVRGPLPIQGPQHRWATEADFGELFTLQRAAFVDEAFAYDLSLIHI